MPIRAIILANEITEIKVIKVNHNKIKQAKNLSTPVFPLTAYFCFGITSKTTVSPQNVTTLRQLPFSKYGGSHMTTAQL
jgi:hypothetical protein